MRPPGSLSNGMSKVVYVAGTPSACVTAESAPRLSKEAMAAIDFDGMIVCPFEAQPVYCTSFWQSPECFPIVSTGWMLDVRNAAGVVWTLCEEFQTDAAVSFEGSLQRFDLLSLPGASPEE